ncbi:g3782 [Coccomyxa viridis]|uniref:G3782 protein n=1 Tax=Coccomyxa viridis TaxID=1274662 RepID=A0ABP1FNP6_9CHLO
MWTELEAKQKALSTELRAIIEEGLPEHQDVWEEFSSTSWELEAAEAAQDDAPLIAKLQEKQQALHAKLIPAAEGLPRFKEVASALEKCVRQLEAEELGSRCCSDDFQCASRQEGAECKDGLPLRRRPYPLHVASKKHQVQSRPGYQGGLESAL